MYIHSYVDPQVKIYMNNFLKIAKAFTIIFAPSDLCILLFKIGVITCVNVI